MQRGRDNAETLIAGGEASDKSGDNDEADRQMMKALSCQVRVWISDWKQQGVIEEL